MITEKFTLEEIYEEILRVYPKISFYSERVMSKYKKEFLKRKHSFKYPFVFAKIEEVIVNHNTYLFIMGSPTLNIKDFGCQIYLRLETSNGRKYYRILCGGYVQEFTKHYIDRFVERSPYNCNKDNFLPYLVKDNSVWNKLYTDTNEIQYINTVSGIAVVSKFTMITYIHDLGPNKERIKQELKSFADSLPISDIRNASIQAVIELNGGRKTTAMENLV